MLTNLNIHGLAIIESLTIDFSSSFNVITGETGAGKSILIKALSLLLGAKANAEVIRGGFSQAIISGMFKVDYKHKVFNILEELGIPFDEENKEPSILIRRQIHEKGRSGAWVNDIPVTLGSLKQIAYVLIDIFGQHENQRLLDSNEHLFYLDQFLFSVEAKANVEIFFQKSISLFKEIEAVTSDFQNKIRSYDYLQHRYDEIQSFDPSEDDYLLKKEIIESAKKSILVKENLKTVQEMIDGSSSGQPLAKVLWSVSKLFGIGPVPDDLMGASEEIQKIASQLDEISYMIDRSLEKISVNESDLESAQDRLSKYQDFFRKLLVNDVSGLMDEKQRICSELNFLNQASEEIKNKLIELDNYCEKLKTYALKLTEERKKAAREVKKKVERELDELGMKGARLEVEFQKIVRQPKVLDLKGLSEEINSTWGKVALFLSEITSQGFEKAQFLLSSNPGEPLYPLQKIASGGEISRIMLALKKVLAAGGDTCVLVFDEIDTGISGKIADIVGRKIGELSKNFQIICISHLAQVAVYADRHFMVSKKQCNSRTEAKIFRLSAEDSAREIARLLSGNEITKVSIANAKALVKEARSIHEPG
ncbi:MAG: DNA repair protein RecN [Oligoflexales bacterium]|nr:DNA repair protein RecN [Oligoflexales bacterium]